MAAVEAGADRQIRVRDSETLEIQFEFRAHDGTINALAWHPTRPIVASGGEDHALRIWNVDTGELVREVYGATAAIDHIRFSPDGSRIGASTVIPECKLRIWDFDELLAGPRELEVGAARAAGLKAGTESYRRSQ